MKKLLSLLLCVILILTCGVFQASAEEENFVPYVIDFSLTSPIYENANKQTDSRATGLITSYRLQLSVTGTTLRIIAETNGSPEVVRSGFKDFVVQRKKTTSAVWSDYYDYGDLFVDTFAAELDTTLAVTSGYEYRVSCKHYAKKSLLVTQSVSNTSNIVIV